MTARHATIARKSAGFAHERIGAASRGLIASAVWLAMAAPAYAALQDHGPSDPTLNWPLWYRDLNGLPLGLCKSQADSPNVPPPGSPMCFPLAPDPAGFAGNIGEEMFYSNLNVDITNPSIELRYVTALEAAYGNVAGTPVKGQEIVFTRVRFVMHVLRPECAGNYTIIHPFGQQSYSDVPEGRRALFDTLDIPLGAPGDFEGALNGSLGPFLQWDDGAGNPVTIAVGAERFVGDPNVQHTFTGSPFVDAAGQPQNYVRVIGPTGCDLDGLGHNETTVKEGFLLGQVWTAPIAIATRVTDAVFTRDATTNTVDVWATTAPGNQLILTGTDLPSVRMIEEKSATGASTGHYHSHIEYPSSQPLPPSVTVTNITSNPIIQSSAPLVDVVDITGTAYDPATRTLCVMAHSLDQPPAPLAAPQLVVEVGNYGGPLGDALCPALFGSKPDPRDVAYSVQLPAGPAELTEPPPRIRVQSSRGGRHDRNVAMLAGAPINLPGAPIAVDDAFPVPGLGASVLPVGGNDTPQNAGKVIIISQPATGSVTGSDTGGTATYVAASDALAGSDSFTYVVQDGAGKISNLATAQLAVSFVPQPPITGVDNFAVARNTGNNPSFTVNVLANDKAATGTTLRPGSVTIAQQGNRGAATVNGDGSITYRPTLNVAAGLDAFYYTVASDAGTVSAPTRVDVSVTASAESVSISRNKFANGRWDLRFATTSPGWFGTPLTPTGSCYLIRAGGANLNPAKLIGSAPVDATGIVQIQALSGNGVPSVPAGQAYTIQCATSNHVAAFPSLTNTANTPTSSATAQ